MDRSSRKRPRRDDFEWGDVGDEAGGAERFDASKAGSSSSNGTGRTDQRKKQLLEEFVTELTSPLMGYIRCPARFAPE